MPQRGSAHTLYLYINDLSRTAHVYCKGKRRGSAVSLPPQPKRLRNQSGLSRQALAFAFGEQFVELLLVVVIAKVIV